MEKMILLIREGNSNANFKKQELTSGMIKEIEKIILNRDQYPSEVKTPKPNYLRVIKNKREADFENVQKLYPELQVYQEYFKNFRSRNAYMTIMRQAVVNHMLYISKTNPITLSQMAKVVRVKNHGSVVHLRDMPDSQRHQDYIEVVSVMDKKIKEGLYPIPKRNTCPTVYTWKKLNNEHQL